ncbi:hypothetical protein [Streptomyces sp. NPDC127066]|uniref:hypothetical protein n=1 Tax=Streptomyces sp. NPDC127066 TaxID=3347125 RepID=UPI00365CAF17
MTIEAVVSYVEALSVALGRTLDGTTMRCWSVPAPPIVPPWPTTSPGAATSLPEPES